MKEQMSNIIYEEKQNSQTFKWYLFIYDIKSREPNATRKDNGVD